MQRITMLPQNNPTESDRKTRIPELEKPLLISSETNNNNDNNNNNNKSSESTQKSDETVAELSPAPSEKEKEKEKEKEEEEEEEDSRGSGRERLKRHRVEVAGRVWIPDMWGQEGLLKEWIDCAAFDASLVSSSIMSARDSLVEEGRRANSTSLRLQNGC